MSKGTAANIKKARATVDLIVEAFREGRIAQAVARTWWKRPDVPMDVWSFRNRLICHFAGTGDARGFRQWIDVGRHVRKGARAIYILAPRTRKIRVAEEDENGETVERTIDRLVGFHEIPVFRLEDTEGDEMPYELPQLPEFTLSDVAEKFGVTVRANFFDGRTLGWYLPGAELIEMHTEEEKVFFHELAHAGHIRAIGTEAFRENSYGKNEVVAETVALTLALMTGRTWDQESGTSHRYIENYARDDGRDATDAVFEAIDEIEATLTTIFETHAREAALACAA